MFLSKTRNVLHSLAAVSQIPSIFTISSSRFSPKLTWRDVQHIIVNAAQVTSPVDEGWVSNGAGFHFNHKFGFGRLDASRMVSLAKSWKNVPKQRTCQGPSSSSPQYVSSCFCLTHLFGLLVLSILFCLVASCRVVSCFVVPCSIW